MPKRVVDGEGIWHSDKLATLRPEIKPELANLIPLALANGSFECTPAKVWSKVYAENRPEVSLAHVEQMLDELERAKILFRWSAEGKTWGYWTGIEKPGRLPPPSRRGETGGRHEALGAEPPRAALDAFLARQTSGQPMANHNLTNGQPIDADAPYAGAPEIGKSNKIDGQPTANQRLTNGCLGLGSGLGSGLGLGDETVPPENSKTVPPETPNFDPDSSLDEWCLKTLRLYPKWDQSIQVVPPGLSNLYLQLLEREAPARGGMTKGAEWFHALVRDYVAAHPDGKVMYLDQFLRGGYATVRAAPAASSATAPSGGVMKRCVKGDPSRVIVVRPIA